MASCVASTVPAICGRTSEPVHDPVKIGLARQRHRQRRGSGFAVALQAETAQRGVEFSQIVRMEIDGERRRSL